MTKLQQITSTVFMVKPVRFGFNPETAGNNAFQKEGYQEGAQENALLEFMAYTSLLKANGIKVVLAEDTPTPFTPDSIFPNNWFTTHQDGTLVLYPMNAENRRKERKSEFIDAINKNFKVKKVVDLSHWEDENLFLEGTGSMILDRCNKIVYACNSPRTSPEVLADFCKQVGYTQVTFNGIDQNGQAIYHTNVMMCIGSKFAIICLDAITDTEEDKSTGISGRQRIIDSLKTNGKEIIDISFEQMNHFSGNMLELKNSDDEKFLIMSGTARKCLTKSQSKIFNNYYHRILSPQLDFIEMNGGGSARCMLAELMEY
ncbi:MAG: arginine deiminase-related protein [Bacteroidales bacterium]